MANHLINDQFSSMEASRGGSSVEPGCDTRHHSDSAEGESHVAKQSSDKSEWESDVGNDNSGGGWGNGGGGGYGGGEYGGGGSDVGGSGSGGWD